MWVLQQHEVCFRYNLRSGVITIIIIIIIIIILLLWLEREKNNAWNIHLTNRQPPPNLHNLTSAWPVMLLANQRLPDVNQILARMYDVSFEMSFKEEKIFKYVHVQMALHKENV